MIPERIKGLFWDVNNEIVDKDRHHPYIIKRIMDYGNIEDLKWMLATYSGQEIVGVLKKNRGLSRKSAYFWAAYFNIPKEEITCLKMPYQKNSRPF